MLIVLTIAIFDLKHGLRNTLVKSFFANTGPIGASIFLITSHPWGRDFFSYPSIASSTASEYKFRSADLIPMPKNVEAGLAPALQSLSLS